MYEWVETSSFRRSQAWCELVMICFLYGFGKSSWVSCYNFNQLSWLSRVGVGARRGSPRMHRVAWDWMSCNWRLECWVQVDTAYLFKRRQIFSYLKQQSLFSRISLKSQWRFLIEQGRQLPLTTTVSDIQTVRMWTKIKFHPVKFA